MDGPDARGPFDPLLGGVDLVTFDCFGTLVDWTAGLAELGVGPERMPQFRNECELRQRPHRRGAAFIPYRQLLEQVAAAVAPDLPAETHAAFARRFGELPLFPDVREAMGLLSQCVAIGVVSNCDAVHQLDVSRQLGVPWDVCVTAEELGAYKPTDPAWDGAVALVEAAGFSRDRWLHVSAWDDDDLAPAAMRGVATCWIGREGGVAPALGACDLLFADLTTLAEAFASAKRGPILHEVVFTGAAAALDRLLTLPVPRARRVELVRESPMCLRLLARFTTEALHRAFVREASRWSFEGVVVEHHHGRVVARPPSP